MSPMRKYKSYSEGYKAPKGFNIEAVKRQRTTAGVCHFIARITCSYVNTDSDLLPHHVVEVHSNLLTSCGFAASNLFEPHNRIYIGFGTRRESAPGYPGLLFNKTTGISQAKGRSNFNFSDIGIPAPNLKAQTQGL